MKPINFKPNATDAGLIDAIKKEKKLKTNADLIRAALTHYAMVSLPADTYESIIFTAFQNENIYFDVKKEEEVPKFCPMCEELRSPQHVKCFKCNFNFDGD